MSPYAPTPHGPGNPRWPRWHARLRRGLANRTHGHHPTHRPRSPRKMQSATRRPKVPSVGSHSTCPHSRPTTYHARHQSHDVVHQQWTCGNRKTWSVVRSSNHVRCSAYHTVWNIAVSELTSSPLVYRHCHHDDQTSWYSSNTKKVMKLFLILLFFSGLILPGNIFSLKKLKWVSRILIEREEKK